MSKFRRKYGSLKNILKAQSAAAAAAKAAAEQKAKQEAEQKLVANASAIKDSGRTTDMVNSTSQAGNEQVSQSAVATSPNSDNLDVYINNMRNRKSRKGAALPQLSGVLGQAGALGV